MRQRAMPLQAEQAEATEPMRTLLGSLETNNGPTRLGRGATGSKCAALGEHGSHGVLGSS
jgi:hypothetical protein